ncbi:MAG: preprotein translocase subunit SecG [Saprospiraceae bacterium]|jgi:preprotein translocase subunit SecG|nr:preprotein translocase subunit SecG [Saprospiraceae bacterium]MDP4821890.1 preprotein translocase subunit SecG [Saprospiraceae bacterium]MDP4999498.1 preprotein translocase subunit SecG [Saprospiraceae bacterium]
MLTTIIVFIALICLLLIVVVLVQNPKGGGVDSTFGGNQATQMFGAAKSADFIEKATWYLALALFILCIVTTLMVGNNGTAEGLVPLLSE